MGGLEMNRIRIEASPKLLPRRFVSKLLAEFNRITLNRDVRLRVRLHSIVCVYKGYRAERLINPIFCVKLPELYQRQTASFLYSIAHSLSEAASDIEHGTSNPVQTIFSTWWKLQ